MGKLPYIHKQTTFIDYIHHFYSSKHPEDSIPSEGMFLDEYFKEIEEIALFYSTYKNAFSEFASLYVLMNLYPFIELKY